MKRWSAAVSVAAIIIIAISAGYPPPAIAAQRFAQMLADAEGLPPNPVEISENPGKVSRSKSDQERREACERDRSAKAHAFGGPSETAILDQAIELDCPK